MPQAQLSAASARQQARSALSLIWSGSKHLFTVQARRASSLIGSGVHLLIVQARRASSLVWNDAHLLIVQPVAEGHDAAAARLQYAEDLRKHALWLRRGRSSVRRMPPAAHTQDT